MTLSSVKSGSGLMLGTNLGHIESLIHANGGDFNAAWKHAKEILSAQSPQFLRTMNGSKPHLTQIDSWEKLNQNPSYSGGKWDRNETLPLRYAIELANDLDCIGYHCIPHRLDNDSVRQYCEVIEAESDKPYILSFSNECWNRGHPQWSPQVAEHHTWLAQQSNGDWMQTVADRTQVIAQHIGARGKLVVGAQSAWSDVADKLLGGYGLGDVVDAVAVAPYYIPNHVVFNDNTGLTPETLTYSQLTELATQDILGRVTDDIKAHKVLADRHGVELYVYEHNSHLVLDGHAWLDDWHKAERPRLNELLIEVMADNGVSVACVYSSWSRWGNMRFGLFNLAA